MSFGFLYDSLMRCTDCTVLYVPEIGTRLMCNLTGAWKRSHWTSALNLGQGLLKQPKTESDRIDIEILCCRYHRQTSRCYRLQLLSWIALQSLPH